MSQHQQPDVSVVIGFKDWGRDRVALAVKSLHRSFAPLSGEVIVSDYGSTEPGREDFAQHIVDLGGRYVYTETDGIWSRSRALNAGFASSRGSVLVSTDADMLFSEGSLGVVGRMILNDPQRAVVLQCRDLPEGSLPPDFDGESVDWEALENSARLRPRWGMGGMMACSRKAFLHVRGLDERMLIYGGEDIDFANRLRRAGLRLEWVNDPSVRMYHMWHPPTRAAASATEAGKAAIVENSRIHATDNSFIRNRLAWRYAPSDREIPISVVISTHNRADCLGDAISSVLAQSVSDFELIVVDDGSTDETAEVVSAFKDDRIRYFRRNENGGLAAARNFAADVSRGRYTVVHDDDDIMLPWRLASHLDALTSDVHGSYGGWVDFDNETGALNPLYGKVLSLGSLLFTGKVYAHGTVMVETSILRRIRYDETLRSGSDYNLGIRLIRSGVRLQHTGEFHILRRLHSGQITETQAGIQTTSAVLSSAMAKAPMSVGQIGSLRDSQPKTLQPPVRGADNLDEHVAPYLPDHLAKRCAIVEFDPSAPRSAASRDWITENATTYIRVETADGDVEYERATIEDASLRHLAEAASQGFRVSVQASQRCEGVQAGTVSGTSGLGVMMAKNGDPYVTEVLLRSAAVPYLFAFSAAPLKALELCALPGYERVVSDGHETLHLIVVPNSDIRALRDGLQRLSGLAGVIRSGLGVPLVGNSDEAIATLMSDRRTQS